MIADTEIKGQRRELDRQRKRASWLRAQYLDAKRQRTGSAQFFKVMAEQAESTVRFLEASFAKTINLQKRGEDLILRMAELENKMRSLRDKIKRRED